MLQWHKQTKEAKQPGQGMSLGQTGTEEVRVYAMENVRMTDLKGPDPLFPAAQGDTGQGVSLERNGAKQGRRRWMATATCSAAKYWGEQEPPLQHGGQAPGMSADPLIDDGHTSILVQLQLLPRGLKPHHFR